jgi:hypothetical protein
MLRFFKQVLRFLFVLLLLILTIISYTNFKINNSGKFKLDKNIKHLFLGHSLPEGAFNDSLISNSKNLSQSGELFFYTYIKLKKILEENNQIENVFVEFTNNQITIDMEKWTKNKEQILYRVPKYAPVMKFEDYIYISSKNPKAFIQTVPLILKNNINFIIFNKNDYILNNDWGKYYYNKRNHIDSLITIKNSGKLQIQDVSKFTDINVKYLLKIVELCSIKNVNFFLTRCPVHKEYPGKVNETLFQNILKSNFSHIVFLDFLDFPIANDEFGDFDHLNYKGAKKFSMFFDSLLKKGINENFNSKLMIQNELLKYN